MSANDVLEMCKELIGTVGFPIGVCVVLLMHEFTTQKKFEGELRKLSQSVETLTNQLGEIIVRLVNSERR